MRKSNRGTEDLRQIEIIPNVNLYAEGSCLIKCGNTHVLCTASVSQEIPAWLKGGNRGWVTAEYSLLPRATQTRVNRETKGVGGRTAEIQRLIGRSLRAAVDLTEMPEICVQVDCDVLQADGGTRTGLQGLLYYLTPHTEGLTIHRFLQISLDAMSQLFFSLSVSMGIMITYGSYVKPDVDLNRSISQIEFFDTGVALLAGAMIVPAVYVFSGTEGMGAGPSLMFISLPKVFDAMGFAGTVVGILFFVSAIFATLTSCISVLEAITANCMEIFHTSRKKTVLVLSVIYLAASAVIALGYSVFYFEVQLPNGSAAQLLDIMDYVSNSVMMPLISLLSTILIGWVLKPQFIAEEMEKGSGKFTRKALYTVIIRYVAPIVMLILFLQSTGILA